MSIAIIVSVVLIIHGIIAIYFAATELKVAQPLLASCGVAEALIGLYLLAIVLRGGSA